MVTVTVNGTGQTFDAGASVADLVDGCCDSRDGIAVACNGEVVPRSAWAATGLAERDRSEIVTAAAGG